MHIHYLWALPSVLNLSPTLQDYRPPGSPHEPAAVALAADDGYGAIIVTSIRAEPTGNVKHPLWARREIERLDPVKDARRIAHLLFEVRYGVPAFIHPLFALAFARQVAVPRIARGSPWRPRHHPERSARRNDDTLVFFGLLFRHGDNPEGRKVVARIAGMHSRFPISNDLHLYTLATLACLPQRVGQEFTGRELLSEKRTLPSITSGAASAR